MSAKPIAARKKLPGRLAAAVLAVITLVAFFILQDYGPVSAVRRFHEALRRSNLPAVQQALASGDAAAFIQRLGSGNAATIQQVSEEPVGDPSVQYMALHLSPLILQGIQPQLAKTEREGERDDVVVVYHLPNGEMLAIVWIVDRKGSIWKINAQETAEALYESLGH